MMIKRMLVSGLVQADAEAYYGLFTSVVIRLINIPTALALAISMSLVPAISACKARNDDAAVRKETDTGMRYAFIIGFPCSVGMSVLSKQIVSFFYSNVKEFTPDKIQLASTYLQSHRRRQSVTRGMRPMAYSRWEAPSDGKARGFPPWKSRPPEADF